MVDPNRKINRLTDKDIEFLDECEEEFANRYTEEDESYMQYVSKSLADPPIVENCSSGGGQQNHHGGSAGRAGMRSNRGRHDRRGNNRSNFRHGRYNPYDTKRGRNDDRGQPSHPPMNVRRDYSNFVAATKD